MHRHYSIIIEMIILIFLSLQFLSGQVMNPADVQRKPDTLAVEQKAEEMVRYRSWEYPPITVVSTRLPNLREEERIGKYAQPRWTAIRRFPTTRVYIVPEGKMEFEYWLRTTIDKDGNVSYRSLWEVEFGLPHRFQLDMYYRTDQSKRSSRILISEQIELRYALADWDRIWGNPTLYFEWIRKESKPDVLEPKLLLGGEIAPRWHWGLNAVAEFEAGGKREYEYSVRSGLSYTALDYQLAVGAETIIMFADVKTDRGNYEKSALLGPSIQYRPFPQFTINMSGLIGLTTNSPQAQIWFNSGWEF